MEGCRPRREGHGVGHAAAVGQLGFEGVEIGPDRGHPPGGQRGQQGFLLGEAHVGRREPDAARLTRSGPRRTGGCRGHRRRGRRGCWGLRRRGRARHRRRRRAQLRHRRLTFGADAAAPGQRHHGAGHDPQVEPQGPVLDVPDVEGEALLPADVVASVHLGPAGQPRPHGVAAVLGRGVAADVRHRQGPGPDEAHVAPQDVPELGQLVEAQRP